MSKPKKNPKADIEKCRPILMQIGLIAALGAALTVINYESEPREFEYKTIKTEGIEIEKISGKDTIKIEPPETAEYKPAKNKP